MSDCACGHPKSTHGRRGYGSCRVLIPSDFAAAKVAEWSKQYSPEVTLRLAETLMALPGGHDGCHCKRFHVSAAAVRE